jgi:CRISPR/Cas system Type II protein with McrA/HNH and RuvC-like nuclease domain
MAARREDRALRDIPRRLRYEVLQAGECHYCGSSFPSEVDHVVPFSRGGETVRENLVAACGPCNQEKLDFTPEEWRAYREERGLPWPPLGRAGNIRQVIEEAAAAAGLTVAEFSARALNGLTTSATEQAS